MKLKAVETWPLNFCKEKGGAKMIKMEIEIPYRVYEIIINDETSPSIPIIKNAIKNGKILLSEEVIKETKEMYESLYGKEKEEAKEYLYKISYDIGSTAMEYLSDKDGIKMREAIDILYSKEEAE